MSPNGPHLSKTIVAIAVATVLIPIGMASSSANSTTTPRVKGSPALTFDRKHPKAGLTAYVRFDREVPRRASGAPLVRISVAGSNSAIHPAATVGRRSRGCYTAGLKGDVQGRLRTGMRVSLRVDVGPSDRFKRYRFSVRVRGLDHVPTHQTDNPVLRQLGCVNG